MKHQISVITVQLNGKKRFVKVSDQRSDGRRMMEYVGDPADATEYENEEEASKQISSLHNPLERELSTDTVTIHLVPSVPKLSGSFK